MASAQALTQASMLQAYQASQDAGYSLATVLGILDCAKATGTPVDGASLIAALEEVQRSVVDARNAALILCTVNGLAG